jgi:hypothetical protein
MMQVPPEQAIGLYSNTVQNLDIEQALEVRWQWHCNPPLSSINN